MPNYLTRKDNTYYFRQAVPVELRRILDRREIKKSLGHDYVAAVSACKRHAVIADNLLVKSRAKLDSAPLSSRPCPPAASHPAFANLWRLPRLHGGLQPFQGGITGLGIERPETGEVRSGLSRCGQGYRGCVGRECQ